MWRQSLDLMEMLLHDRSQHRIVPGWPPQFALSRAFYNHFTVHGNLIHHKVARTAGHPQHPGGALTAALRRRPAAFGCPQGKGEPGQSPPREHVRALSGASGRQGVRW